MNAFELSARTHVRFNERQMLILASLGYDYGWLLPWSGYKMTWITPSGSYIIVYILGSETQIPSTVPSIMILEIETMFQTFTKNCHIEEA